MVSVKQTINFSFFLMMFLREDIFGEQSPRSVPKRGSVGWVSKCWQLFDPRDSPDATANRYWPVSQLDRLVAA